MTDKSDIEKKTNGRKPDYRVTTPVEKKGGAFFMDIGGGWSFDGDRTNGISLTLNALPVNGKIVIFPIEPKE